MRSAAEHATSSPPASRRRRRRWITLGSIALVVVGVAIFVLAYFQPQKLFIDDHVDEALPAAEAAGAVAERSGPFVSREHSTSGVATIYRLEDGRRFLRIDDLHTSNGPALFVYLSANPAGGRESAFDDRYLNLGGLKGNIGSQNYEIPAEAVLADYSSVVIWCDRFDVAFGAADLS
jgi:hypothetical protein